MIDTLVPSAGDYAKKIAVADAEEAAKESRARHQAELEKKSVAGSIAEAIGGLG